jgi:cell division protein FtsQ
MAEIKEMALFMKQDSFWMAQVDQCDINDQRRFELVPKMGDHLILFGNGKEIPEKFRKLNIFYQQVLAKTGFNTYQDINVEFEGQVVATKRNSRYMHADTAKASLWKKQWLSMTQHQVLSKDSATLTPKSKEELDLRSSKQSVPDPMKIKSSNKNPVPGKPKQSGTKGALPAEKTTPKAVMSKAENES